MNATKIAGLILVLPFLTSTAEARCAREAREIGIASAQAYCKEVKDAFADQVVIHPITQLEETLPENDCTYEDTLLCKTIMARRVGQDRFCYRLYKSDLHWDITDDEGNFLGDTNSKEFYASMMASCVLHN